MEDYANLIKRLVEMLNERGLEPLSSDDVPPELRTEELCEISDVYRWKIFCAGPNPWVDALEQKLPWRLPKPYYVLISRYRFAEFELGPILFLANTGTTIYNELADVMFRDKALSPALLQNGLLQFGKQAGGGYDPVCFDMKRRVSGDAPLVRIDHEDVLIRSRIRVTDEIAPSFQRFVEQVIAGKNSPR